MHQHPERGSRIGTSLVTEHKRPSHSHQQREGDKESLPGGGNYVASGFLQAMPTRPCFGIPEAWSAWAFSLHPIPFQLALAMPGWTPLSSGAVPSHGLGSATPSPAPCLGLLWWDGKMRPLVLCPKAWRTHNTEAVEETQTPNAIEDTGGCSSC